MIFPALLEFPRDRAVATHPATIILYLYLLAELDREPRRVKVWMVADDLRLRKATVIAALNRLVAHGYLVEHAREERKVRQFSLAFTRAKPPAAISGVPARTYPIAA